MCFLNIHAKHMFSKHITLMVEGMSTNTLKLPNTTEIKLFWFFWFTIARNHLNNKVFLVLLANRRGGKVTAKHMLNKQITLATSP